MPSTGKPVEELSGQELDACVAEEVMDLKRVLGHEVKADWPKDLSYQVEPLDDDEHYWLVVTGPDTIELVGDPPPYSTDIAAAWQMEERLVERGWHASYCVHLLEMLGARRDLLDWDEGADGTLRPTGSVDPWTLFDFVHATPRQRAVAAVKAARSMSKDTG